MRGNLGLLVSDRGGAGHSLGGRGRIKVFLEEVVAEMGSEGGENLCR